MAPEPHRNWRRYLYLFIVVLAGAMLVLAFPDPWSTGLAIAGTITLSLFIFDKTGMH